MNEKMSTNEGNREESEKSNRDTKKLTQRKKLVKEKNSSKPEALIKEDGNNDDSSDADKKSVELKPRQLEHETPRRAVHKIQISSQTILKLILFTILMFTLPLFTYFYTLDLVFNGNHMYSAISSAIVANLVLIGYIFSAFMEDFNEQEQKKTS